MGWADNYIRILKTDETVAFRPRGNSMTGKINNGQLVTVVPVTEETILNKGDVVLCKVNGNQFLHLITACKHERYQISNNHGHVNGWAKRDMIYGVVIKVE